MYDIRIDGVLAESHEDRHAATLAAIGFKDTDPHRLVIVHDPETGHHWMVGGAGCVSQPPAHRRALQRFLRSVNLFA